MTLYFSFQVIVDPTPPHREAIDCAMDILIQNNDSHIVSTTWFSKEFPEFTRYGKVGL